MDAQDNEHIADVSDIATKREGEFLDAAITEARRMTGPKATGHCLYCSELLVAPELIDAIRAGQADAGGVPRFCDKECRDDHEHEQRRKKINGR